jgi:hypothetical protein
MTRAKICKCALSPAGTRRQIASVIPSARLSGRGRFIIFARWYYVISAPNHIRPSVGEAHMIKSRAQGDREREEKKLSEEINFL